MVAAPVEEEDEEPEEAAEQGASVEEVAIEERGSRQARLVHGIDRLRARLNSIEANREGR